MGLKNFFNLLNSPKTKKSFKFVGEIIHSVRDEQGLIQVVDNSISRSLHFDSPVEQSKIYFHSPLNLAFEYQQKIEKLVLEISGKHKINSILMLGVGGGTLASKLHLSLPKTQMTLIDNRQKVLEIAYDFFNLPQVDEIQTLCDDAYDFIFSTQETYDLIIIDTYDANEMPEKFVQEDFLHQLLKIKNPLGYLIFNLWQSTPTPTLKVINYFEELGKLDLIDIKSSSNLILGYPAS